MLRLAFGETPVVGPSQAGDTTVVVHVVAYIQQVAYLNHWPWRRRSLSEAAQFTLNQSELKSAEESPKPAFFPNVLIKSQRKADDSVEHRAEQMAQKTGCQVLKTFVLWSIYLFIYFFF